MAECHLGLAGAKSPKKVLWVTIRFASSSCGPLLASQPTIQAHCRNKVLLQSPFTLWWRGLSCGAGNGHQCLCLAGMHFLNECCQRGDVVKPGEVSLRLDRLWSYGFSSSNELPLCGAGMTGLVGCCTQQTQLRKALYNFAWDHLPTLVPASAHMRRPKSSGLETPSEDKRKPVPEPKQPEEFISHVSNFRDGLTWGLLPGCKVNGPYLNLDLWKDRRCLDKVLTNTSIFINVHNESRRTLVSDISREQTIDWPWVAE